MKKIDFQLHEEESYIQLIQLLKATNLVYNGAEAQRVVTEGLVLRNGEIELRKRAKIAQGDIIQFNNYEITIK
jgi:ribosome-associated protein